MNGIFKLDKTGISTAASRDAFDKKAEELYITTINVPNITGTAYYVDSQNGNDLNNGLSESAPFKTLSKANSINLIPGDGILFKRKSYFQTRNVYLRTRSGNSSKPIIYSSYGTGEKPIFTPGITKNNTSDWVGIGSNRWTCTDSIFSGTDGEVSNISMSNDTVYARHLLSLSSLSGNGDYYWQSGKVTMYCDQNPATKYGNLTLGLRWSIMDLNNRSFVIVDGLHFKNAGFVAIAVGMKDITIQNCDISLIGGQRFLSQSILFGNAFSTFSSAINMTYRYNRFWKVHDTAISFQNRDSTGTGATFTGWSIHHNIVESCGTFCEFVNNPPNGNGVVNDIHVEHNTLYDLGGDLAGIRTNDGYSYLLEYWNFRAGQSVVPTNFFIRNNICRINTPWEDGDIHLWSAWWSSGRTNGMTVEGNVLSRATYSVWQNDNVIADPLFINEATGNFHIFAGSPIIGYGVNSGYSKDFDGNSISAPYTPGCFKA